MWSSLNSSEFIHDELRTTLRGEKKQFEIINPGKRHAQNSTGKMLPTKLVYLRFFFLSFEDEFICVLLSLIVNSQ